MNKLVPASALVIDEKTWIAYPHIRSVLTVPFFHKVCCNPKTFHLVVICEQHISCKPASETGFVAMK